MHQAYVSVCPTTGQRISPFTLVNEDEILVGSVVGERYHVRDVLGQGTTGTVFAVEHLSFPRPAAMKVLRPRYIPLESVIRVFHGEARTAFTVSHACLPEIFEVGQLPDGAPYFMMERLHGETLARRIRRERLSLAAAVDVMMQILSAIETIHARDLLLRDLRPQNIFLSHRRGCRPVVKLLDLGLARLVPLTKVQEEWDSLRTAVGETGAEGSLSMPYYLSPERTRGEHDVEPASDLFIAAIIFYEALTAERPFRATTYEGLLQKIARATPVRMRELRPEIPPELDELVLRALSADPRARPPSAREFQDELRAIFEGARRGSAQSRGAPSVAMPVSAPMSATPATQESSEHIASQHAVSERAASERAASERAASERLASERMSSERTLQLANSRGPSPSSRESSHSLNTITREAPSPVTAPPAVEPPLDPIYEEEQTRTDRRFAEITAGLMQNSRFDEASADNPQRTMPPPGPGDVPIDIDFEEEPTKTSRPDELDAEVAAWRARRRANEEDETETMQISADLRSRLDEIELKRGDPSAPPPTTRAKPRG
jgi:serine/threonine protein kinase